jgi:16S rRNA (guanine527-N7)-methyltransferase
MRSGSPADPDFPALHSACGELDLDLTVPQFELLGCYVALLRDWNTRINLVSRRDSGRILSYHVLDSLAAAQLIPRGSRCCDVGTGAGLPGIPLAIARPDVHMILVESVRKKCGFLSAAVAELGLGSVEVACARAEELDPLACDVVLSRLTGPLRTTLGRLARHARSGGLVILYKSPSAADALPGPLLARLGLSLTQTLDLTLPLCSVPRRFLVLRRA